MDKHKETLETWNKVASLYQEKFMKMDIYNDTYDFICNSIEKPNAKLLEIGCGPGNITSYLLAKRPDFDIFGIDNAPNMIELAKLNNPKADFAVMDCRLIKNLKDQYDGIVGGFCLPYLSSIESNDLIATAYNLLNENGLLYLSFVEGNPEESDFKVGSGGRVFFNYHKLEEIIAQLNSFNFRDINTFKVEYKISDSEFDIHTILTAKKH
ncbi:class I SAM-dependent methyltransferase [Flavobacterium urocaniciphilum]|uniref:Methyltransferase domain-containing protein n=1 Tax=Flavobacterium urocaniciphilum TaxID=1299341 RepID=A0A1H9D3F8_9FLAO|nr:class I SAM-dependent methyltransferase [Flavobacterium urocaniciphilum]SEQ08012.1 Methyltransferase domain-containing protein [Flavobacterium urocaniciphilum]